jgi:predicted DNA-binding transcriptional regulator AlpA
MNLIELYCPTLTLKELCKILNICRSSYYIYINDEVGNLHYKVNFPRPMSGYSRKRFVTQDLESYLLTFTRG